MNYRQKLLDPRWQKKRLSIFERDNWKCSMCSSEDNTLHAHHVYYEYGANPWDYPDYALTTLCSDCHEQEHEALKYAILSLSKTMAQAGIRTSDQIAYMESVIRENFSEGVFRG